VVKGGITRDCGLGLSLRHEFLERGLFWTLFLNMSFHFINLFFQLCVSLLSSSVGVFDPDRVSPLPALPVLFSIFLLAVSQATKAVASGIGSIAISGFSYFAGVSCLYLEAKRRVSGNVGKRPHRRPIANFP
jgi:hypothetical protein